MTIQCESLRNEKKISNFPAFPEKSNKMVTMLRWPENLKKAMSDVICLFALELVAPHFNIVATKTWKPPKLLSFSIFCCCCLFYNLQPGCSETLSLSQCCCLTHSHKLNSIMANIQHSIQVFYLKCYVF